MMNVDFLEKSILLINAIVKEQPVMVCFLVSMGVISFCLYVLLQLVKKAK